MRYYSHRQKNIDDIEKTSVFELTKKRIPWLIIGMAGGVFASKIIESFENTLSQNLFLASFIPLVVYMSDAVGTQIEAFAIRDLSLNQKIDLKKYFIKQLLVIFLISLVIGVLIFIYAFSTENNTRPALVISLSLFLAMMSSIFTGMLIPLVIFKKFKLDPADASGPIATIIQDLLSVTIYFTLASYLL